MKVSKKDWEEFLKWKEQKEKPEQKVEELQIEPEEELSLDDLVTVEEEKEESKEEPYICGNCGYQSDKPFDVCPNCKRKLKWD
jgi:lipopolysaccharide biosynthesis regulator YciM